MNGLSIANLITSVQNNPQKNTLYAKQESPTPGIANNTDSAVTLSDKAQHLSRLEALVNSMVQEPGKEPEPLDLEAMQELDEKLHSGELIYGPELELMLGWMIMGSSAEGWTQQGLDLTKETLIEAGRTFQQAFKEAFNTTDGPASIAFDHHAIVASQQSVPDWFMEQRAQQLELLPDDMRQAFEQGKPYFVTALS
ncbi:hypothetical protein ABMA57_06270 [Saccharospirillum sp. HFRX-1]|uniref:hypothetical protein n=1 Tax=unclassified Saccharospirillum TaxID=2633430 RepID=UPI003714D103